MKIKFASIQKDTIFDISIKQKQSKMKTVQLSLKKLTVNEMLNDDAKDYNNSEWSKMVARYASQKDTEFYKAEKGNGYEYERFYAVYTIKEGIRLLNPIGYGSCLHNGGFVQVIILPESITVIGFGEDGNGRIKNSPAGRKWMAEISQHHNAIFSNDF